MRRAFGTAGRGRTRLLRRRRAPSLGGGPSPRGPHVRARVAPPAWDRHRNANRRGGSAMTGQAMTTNGSAGVEETQVSGNPLSAAFDELRPGLAFASRGRTVTEGDIVSFAGLTGDWHPQHADASWAASSPPPPDGRGPASSPFGERIAHGMLVVSYAIGLLPLDPDRVLALRRVRDAVFKRPVRIGDTIDVEGRIAGVRELDQATGLVECDCRVLNQEGKLVVKLGLDVVWRRGDEAQPDPEPQANSADVPEWRGARGAVPCRGRRGFPRGA